MLDALLSVPDALVFLLAVGDQLPVPPFRIVPQEIYPFVLPQDLEIAVIRCEPSVEDFYNADGSVGQSDPAGDLLASIACIAMDHDVHGRQLLSIACSGITYQSGVP
jgi:hypothetical protein